MRTWLKRQVARVSLPAESSIDPSKWQCHNLRHSRITQLNKEGKRLDQIRLITGHADLRNLQNYIKTDEAELHAQLFADNKADEAAKKQQAVKEATAQRKRDTKAAAKATASLLDLKGERGQGGQLKLSPELVEVGQK